MRTVISVPLVVSAVLGPVLAMLFQTRPYQSQTLSCPSDYPLEAIRSLGPGMSNASHSNIFNRLLPDVLIERVPGTQGNIDVREFIKTEMASLGWRVEEDTFTDRTPYGDVIFSNVIATFNPTAARRVIVACHYDSKYMPDLVEPFVGATDSAVPCSIMMDTARQLAQIMTDAVDLNAMDFSLQFIFFDGEEAFVSWTNTDSIYGARHLAQLWENSVDPNDPTALNNLQNIDAFILLDLIGTTDVKIVNHFPNTAHLFNKLASIERCMKTNDQFARALPQTIFDSNGWSMRVADDHIPFLNRGVPILHLISTPFPSVWHTAQDNGSKLDPALISDFSSIFRIFTAFLIAGV